MLKALATGLITTTLTLSACVIEDLPAGPDANDSALGGKGDSAYHYLVIGNQDTFLKKRLYDADGRPVQAADLELGSEKCSLYAGSHVELQAAPRSVERHLHVNTRRVIPGCEFSQGYVYEDHVVDTGGPQGGGSGGCPANISLRECAFLGAIAYAEGTGDRYDYIFGYHTFSSYWDHPRRVICSNGYCSDAAGRYQFLSTTWDMVDSALGLPDFSPASQDRGALYLIRNRGVYGIDNIDTYGEFSSAIYKLNQEWASLPGSPYGQPTHSMNSLWNEYTRRLGW